MSPINEPIAVIGSACRFPGDSTTPAKLWELLKEPRDVQSRISRFKAESFHHVDGHHHGASNVLDAYMINEDVRTFDPQFFSIQAGEAESIDPQQRVLLESVYEGIESAGITIESLQGTPTAVYVGVMCDDYSGIAYHDGEAIPKYAATGTARSIMSNRISYFFNWTGPSMTIDTACSSSLVAVHQAVQVLRSGESRVAIAAGTNLILGPKMFIAESNLNMLSPTGRSQMWDADANGYARGEGVASVILKTLSAAIADGDNIECIIRETGINQDGRTPGITMPSSTAQAALIRSTYAKAGLDLRKKADRCQYFEAHGTGTKAGDPQEAGAIYKAFFAETGVTDPEDILYVGSVKTVIGHTEGTAGLAGLIKASLAIQNKTIPPNLLFKNLNPELLPYYGHLKVPTEAKAWPELPAGTPRRASVNSFGFGGTNAHAIIEAYEPETQVVKATPTTKNHIPFTFSAPSEKALVAQLNTYLAFLRKNEDVDLKAMSWTLSKRSAFNFRVALSGVTSDAIASKIEAKLEAKSSANTAIGVRAVKDGQGILGVFTGQGAQWAGMARELILGSPFVEAIIDELEESLATLPAAHRPDWSLKKEMLAVGKDSRISEGLMSQPLCTAVQVVLISLLTKAGIKFESVVGHSSGEIAAAYAAGYINSHDAIRIAYYRGFYAKLAKGPNGEKGSMVAAGTSLEDARELCLLPEVEGKLQVAASNSTSSVTLSGDEEAVEFILEVLKDEGKFARQLKVDTAYHSHHMIPCSVGYTQSLKDCKIQILTPPEGACTWYSSVFGGKVPVASDGLESTYWMQNMLQPVLFSQALTAALNDREAPAIVLEVGPHPALKGPASTTIEEVLGHPVPYGGTLARGANDIETFADALGYLWTSFGPSAVDFMGFKQAFANDSSNELMKTLPKYSWDHDRVYFYESRTYRMQRSRKDPTHELLGVRQDDEIEGELRWRNYLKPSEIPWLSGHVIQGQPLFPAAGFAVMAVEASKFLATAEQVSMIELHNFSIHRALAFPDEAAGVETIFTLSNITKTSDTITAIFACDACSNRESGTLASMSNGKLVIRLGAQSKTSLPDRPEQIAELRDIDVDEFYSSLSPLGYNYNGLLRGISSLKRLKDISAGTIYIPDDVDNPCSYVIHPATLDVGFQALFGSIGEPGDGRLWTLHVPTTIDCIKINPTACPPGGGLGVELTFNTGLATTQPQWTPGFTGDIHIYDEAGKHCLVQCESLRVSALSQPTINDDRHLFAETSWSGAEPKAEIGFSEWVETPLETELRDLVERACLLYLKELHETITHAEREACTDDHRKSLLSWAEHIVHTTASGSHPILKKEWLNDTAETLKPQLHAMAKSNDDMNKLISVGEDMIPFIRGQITTFQAFQDEDLLEWFYKDTRGRVEYNAYVGGIVNQIAHRFPYMNILELGAGTGSVTEQVIKEIGDSHSSYTYTDISVGYFPDAMTKFKSHSASFNYKILDISKDITEQGFEEGGYDLIVAANVLHVTNCLDDTMANCRKLLRPGGYLLVLEITDVDWLRVAFFFSTMSGWFAGANDGRPYTPLVSKGTWDSIFRRNGFSGIDTVTPESGSWVAPFSIMVTQALDTQMTLIKDPLAATLSKPLIENLLIIGGQQMATYDLSEEIQNLLKPFCGNIVSIDKLEDLDEENFSGNHTVLCLSELDESVFKPFTEEKYKSVQTITDQGKKILWVVQGANGENPYSKMMLAVSRCLTTERKESLHFQFMDVDPSEQPQAKLIAETLLRMPISDSWKNIVDYNPMWTLEREMHVANGEIQIPRYQRHQGLNSRYNSNRRVIRNDLSLAENTVILGATNTNFELEEYLPLVHDIEASQAPNLVTVNVKRSILTPLKVKSVGSLYLVLGEVVGTNEKVLALSETHRSNIATPKAWTVACDVSEDKEQALLIAAANELTADSILGKAANTTFWIHEPTPLLAKAISRKAADRNVNVVFTTSKAENTDFRLVHPSTSPTTIYALIPSGVSVFVDLSTATHADAVGVLIASLLPAKCKSKNAAAFFGREAFSQAVSSESVSKIVSNCYIQALPNLAAVVATQDIALKNIPQCLIDIAELRTVDWKADLAVPVKSILAEKMVTFRGDRTYWLIGMAGDLGLSITQWMVERGARHIVLTSRTPKVDQGWLDTMSVLGANIQVWPMDITNRSSTMKCFKKIKDTLPPIAGVANAAMVMLDGLLASMPYDKFSKTLKPKVDGTLFLDELFPKNTLDFFILFSSLTYVAGNIGQTAYSVANGFMVGLAEGRRKRGLAASVMNLAGVFGVGYISRIDKTIHDRLSIVGFGHISEWDCHQFMAEAVLASHPKSGLNVEISNAVNQFYPDRDSDLPFWIDLPRFAKFKVIKANATSGKSDKKTVSVRAQLVEQTDEEGVRSVLLVGFLGALYQQLNMLPEDNGITPESSLVELGIDSLVAVDMRAWFQSELDLDMPVLKILGGATVAAMVDDAFTRLNRELIPNFKTEDVKADDAAEPEKKQGAKSIDSESSSIVMVNESMAEDSQQGTGTPPSSEPSAHDDKHDLEAIKPMPTFVKTEKMAFGASQFWFLTQFLEDPTHFNIQFCLALDGALNIPRMEAAVEHLGQRHEAFRTAYYANPERFNEPTQGVIANSNLHLETKKVTSEAEVEAESKIMREHVFDIERGEVIKVVLLSLNKNTHFMVFGFHHIAIDGFGFNILMMEMSSLYQGNELKPVKLQYSDYAVKQRAAVESGSMAEELKYWKGVFTKIPDPLPLFPVASVNSRQMMTHYEHNTADEIQLDSKTIAQIKDLCRRNGCTKFHFFLATLKIFLFRFLDIEDVCIGLADANRNDSESDLTMGYLLNLLPLKFDRNAKEDFSTAIKEARDKSYAALGHSRLPFDVLLENLDAPRSSSSSPLFQVLMDYRQMSAKLPLLDARSWGTQLPGRTAHDLVLDISDVSSTDIRLVFKTQQYLYSKTAANILQKSYVQFLKKVASNSKLQLYTVPMYDSLDIESALDIGRGPTMTTEWPSTVSQRIEDVAVNNNEIALKDETNTLSYSGMNARVDAIASALVDAGVSNGSLVAVFQEPTIDWICSLLAIWKAGAVFVPLDARNTFARLALIVKDCQPTVILIHQATKDEVHELNVDSKLINIGDLKIGATIANRASANSDAMILYSSGTTGTPKGVRLQHGAIRNWCEVFTKQYKFGKEAILQQTAYSFDLALGEVICALTMGGSLYVVPKSKRLDSTAIAELIISEKITYTMATPSEYFSWLRFSSAALADTPAWKHAITCGEACTPALTEEFRALQKPDLELLNIYGPSEITICSHVAVINYQRDEVITVGNILPNSQMYIVDRNLNPVPVGVSGEVVIGGPGVSLGYLNNDALTSSQFIPDVYSGKLFSEDHPKVYRTGDLGHMLADGKLFYEGRIAGDTQIKLRGIRIELKDIESTIITASNGAIFRVVVSLRGDPGFLVAHVEFKSEHDIEDQDKYLRNLLTKLPLPEYMCPAIMLPLAQIPINTHSKVDRRAVADLPLPQASEDDDFDDILTPTEDILQQIWRTIISKDVADHISIRRNTDFFHAGGNSLLLVKLQASIREKFDVVVPMIQMFEASTLARMASQIESQASVALIDWEKETSLDAALLENRSTVSKTAKSTDLTILLTGATGYIGRYELKRLVDDKRISRIHCMAVRRENPKDMPRDVLKQSDKIVVHEGNLSLPNFGLTSSAFAALSNEVDIIIHSGADRNFSDYYQTLRGPNFVSTKTIVDLASSRKIPVHFLSSYGVLSIPTSATPPGNGSNGYIASKWASEKYLTNASKQLGLDVTIHTVVNASSSAPPPADLLQEFTELATELKALPDQSDWNGSFDLIRAEPLVKSIIDSVVASAANTTTATGPEYIHYETEARMSVDELQNFIKEQNQDQQGWKMQAPHYWVGDAKKAGLSWHMASQDLVVGGTFVLKR